MSEILIETRNLKKYFPIHRGFFLRHAADVKAVDDISIKVRKGKTFGIVGESGSGKSTLGRTMIRLYDPTAGDILFRNAPFSRLRGESLRKARRSFQMIFQDPFSSLDPRMTIGQILAEPFKVHHVGSKSEWFGKAGELLQRVGLRSSQINRYPHEFSGGQRQRISIARAIALNPDLVIADEPVSALDVSIQAQILNIMKDLQETLGLTYVFISHDLTVVEHMCDELAVMYLGKIVEQGSRDDIYNAPKHPYTQALLNAIPRIGGQVGNHKSRILKGEVPSPINPPKGCAFHPRCPMKMEQCSQATPRLQTVGGKDTHQVACWLHQ